MTANESYFVNHGGFDYIVSIHEGGDLCLTVHPLSLNEEDTRAIQVIPTEDTETGDKGHAIRLPEVNDGEQEMWGVGVRVAASFMANTEGIAR